MAISGVMKVVCLVLAYMVVAAPCVENAISCMQMLPQLAPCFTFLVSGGTVPENCCNAVRTLNSVAKTTPDRQAACKCLKEAYATVPGINTTYAAELPRKCGVNLPYKISPSIDCSKVS